MKFSALYKPYWNKVGPFQKKKHQKYSTKSTSIFADAKISPLADSPVLPPLPTWISWKPPVRHDRDEGTESGMESMGRHQVNNGEMCCLSNFSLPSVQSHARVTQFNTSQYSIVSSSNNMQIYAEWLSAAYLCIFVARISCDLGIMSIVCSNIPCYRHVLLYIHTLALRFTLIAVLESHLFVSLYDIDVLFFIDIYIYTYPDTQGMVYLLTINMV